MYDKISPYIVYVKTDDANRITAVNSSAFLYDSAGWIEIDNGYTQQYYHAQSSYFQKPIRDGREILRYKMVDGVVVERTAEEMDKDYIIPEDKPTQLDIIEAQVTYTAMMTDTLLEV